MRTSNAGSQYCCGWVGKVKWGWKDGRTDKRTDGWTDRFPLCSTGLRPLQGRCPKNERFWLIFGIFVCGGWGLKGVGRPCPPIRIEIVTLRHLFYLFVLPLASIPVSSCPFWLFISFCFYRSRQKLK